MPVSARAKRFWSRASQSWGSRFTDQYGPTPPEEWQSVIDRVDDERLSRAISVLRTETPNFPPTLGQLEKALPYQLNSQESAPDLLAQAMVRRYANVMCEHQLAFPWTYFGKWVHDGANRPFPETHGVVVHKCKVDDCRGQRRGYQLRLEDIQQ